ncbi:hypothetical protein [Merismopedia glauca]|uniref:Uncharacterized protein n=1 Tax=Merismopedia glauca CCAP 1448/3 TaxID=1296344 RepID=A0A2T1C3I0_9CYAN|nr:hypothetical protein [Merismopedia glauca]PSB02821.1 hypothetical protein C7B64_11380 [Merismopedia glauca CCAP 1448/3]
MAFSPSSRDNKSLSELYWGIIDTERGDRALWQAASPQNLTKLVKQLPDSELPTWQSQVEGLSDSFHMGIFQDSKPLELARTFMREGLNTKDRRFLETAAYYYDRAQQFNEAKYCRSYLLRLNGKLREAGEGFMEIEHLADRSLNHQQDAWECFFLGHHWENMWQWCDRYPEAPAAKWEPVAAFMAQINPKLDASETVAVLAEFTVYLPSILPSKCDHSIWQAVFECYLQGIEEALLAVASLSAKHLDSWEKTLIKIAETGFQGDRTLALAASCAYRDFRCQDAVTLWDKCEDRSYQEHRSYFSAKGMFASVPENVRWFNRAQQPDHIVAIWQNEKHQHQMAVWQPVLAELRQALEKTENYRDLVAIDIKLNQWVRVVRLVASRLQVQDPAFDATFRLQILNRLTSDPLFNPQSIQNEAKQLQISVQTAREAISNFVVETTQLKAWEADLKNVEYIGQFLASIGELVPALGFYKRFRGAADLQLCGLARSRWSQIKHQQAEHSQKRGKIELASRQRQDAERTIESWWCSPKLYVLPKTTSKEIDRALFAALSQKITNRLQKLSPIELKQVYDYINSLESQRDLF